MPHPGFSIWGNSVTEFECFGVGGLLALALHKRLWSVHPAVRLALVALCGFAWFLSDGVLHYRRNEMLPVRSLVVQLGGFQLAVAGCVLLFLAVLGLRVANWATPLIYLGRISYGLYVFHILARYMAMRTFSLAGLHNNATFGWPNVGVLLLAFAITVAMAAASYQFFERPFLRLKDRFTYVSNRVD